MGYERGRAVHYQPQTKHLIPRWIRLGLAKNLFLLSNRLKKGSNSLVLLTYSITDTTAKSLTASRHSEVRTSGLLGMQRHCISSQTFD
ncbi:hypothetical protein Bpro_4665 [Polaromonas sp. JS666]|nr:hypothetical protein Bpro_4665 [Polaromonas sp. JS666]